MKVFVFILLFTSCGLRKPIATIQISDDNIIFEGIPNNLNVHSSGCNCKRIVLKSNDGEMVKIKNSRNCQYLFSPTDVGVARIEMYNRQILGNKIIGTWEYRVRPMVDSSSLRVYINGHPNYSTISKNEILVSIGLAVKFSSSRTNLSGGWQLNRYLAIFVYHNGQERIMVEGNLFNDKFKKLVEKLQENDMVIFRDMETKLYDERILKLEPYIVFIKE